MRIALAQLDPIVGDIAGNLRKVLDAIEQARAQQADLLITSELMLIGYPPRDLVLREGVVPACERAVEHVAAAAGDMTVVVGHLRPAAGKSCCCSNGLSVCCAGKIITTYDKRLLPGYDVFDEDRYFEPGDRASVIEVKGTRIGLLICEDLWRAEDVELERRYEINPIDETLALEPDILVSLNASPFVLGKWYRHIEMQRRIARQLRLPIVSVNQVGANDDLIFDGRSMLINYDGSVGGVLPGWTEAVETFNVWAPRRYAAGDEHQIAIANVSPPTVSDELYHALVLGIRDYVTKTGQQRVLIGLSGGIDSSLTAALAAAALGPHNITGVLMPSRYSSTHSVEDAKELAERLGIGDLRAMPIEPAHAVLRETVAGGLGEQPHDVVDENIQARVRCVLLMALSNAIGGLVLVTSNKSELAMGYTTLYGDMSGALAVLGDVTKNRIYDLARWINEHAESLGFLGPPIPLRCLTKPPSAELRPEQCDQDTLPPYDILDEIVMRRIEREQSAERIIEETGFDAMLVRDVLRIIDREQYKRDQAAVILKVTPRAFGRGRPMPIVVRNSTVGPVDAPPAGDARESERRLSVSPMAEQPAKRRD